MKTSYLIFAIVLLAFSSTIYADKPTKDQILSKLANYSREDLIRIALAGDDFQRSKLPDPIIILRGLREFINDLSNDEIKSIIANQIINTKDLDYDTLIQYSTIDPTAQFDGFADYLNSLELPDLVKFALAAEKYIRMKKGIGEITGGLEDYISKLGKFDVIKIILKFAMEFPELTKADFLKQINGKKVLTLEEIKNFLSSKTHQYLVNLAISCESYERKKKNMQVLGGLHDYAASLNNDKLIDIILSFVRGNPELAFEGQLDNLVNKTTSGKIPLFGGIEDYIRTFCISELRLMALAGETYDRTQRNVKKLGGLEDYINSLSEEDLISIIMQYVNTYPKLRTPGTLEGLAKVQEGGFESTLQNTDMDTLKKDCLAVEAYHVKITGKPIRGGIHDYIDRLSKEKLLEYLCKMSTTYDLIYQKGGIEKIIDNVNKKNLEVA